MTEPSGWITITVDAETGEVPGTRFWVQTDDVDDAAPVDSSMTAPSP